MEKVHEELEEAKAEIQRLKCNLDYKECIINQLSSTIDSQRTECTEKNKCSEERMSAGSDLVQELEEKTRKLEDELKWKVEQFKHLEEAHEKLRERLKSSRTEWEAEKSSLVDEISRLQEGVDDGERASERMKSELALCKQALDNEEIKRKRLEGQVSELKLSLERVNVEGWDGKMETECSTAGTADDEVVADLRHSLRVKEMECKDIEYKARKLEKENQEILASLKELQEAQIPRAVATPSSWAKIRGKLKTLEQTHRDCAANLKAKEAEWRSQSEKLSLIKDQAINELKKDLDSCNCNLTQLKMQNEELSLMLQLLRSEVSETEGSDKEGGLVHLMSQLEKEREEKRGMAYELEEKAERERKLRDELEQVYEALDAIDSELTDITYQGSELEFELQGWMTLAERLKMQLEESQETRRELEASLIAQAEVEEMFNREAEEKDSRISNLEQQILLMDQEIRIEEDGEDEYGGTREDEEEEEELSEGDEDDRLHLDLLARELEVAILAHITEERTRLHHQQYSLQEDEFAKENVTLQNCVVNKTVDPVIDERSPFKVLN